MAKLSPSEQTASRVTRDALLRELRAVVGDAYVLVKKEDVIVYEQDGSILQVMPEIVALPASTEEVAGAVRAAKRANVPLVPRGSGTGLAGGAVPAEGGEIGRASCRERV